MQYTAKALLGLLVCTKFFMSTLLSGTAVCDVYVFICSLQTSICLIHILCYFYVDFSLTSVSSPAFGCPVVRALPYTTVYEIHHVSHPQVVLV